MALGRKFCNHFSLLLLVISVITVSARVKQSETTKRKYKTSKSKPKIDKLNHWPFLPKPGNHYASTKGFPSYPFMILSPPGKLLRDFFFYITNVLLTDVIEMKASSNERPLYSCNTVISTEIIFLI